MTADRAEWTGVGAALAFHVALIAALSTSLASINDVPEPPSMEVELIDEVGLQAAAPTPIAQPAASEPPPMPSAAAQPPPPQPSIAPLPPQRPSPQPSARPAPQPSARPAPQPSARPAPQPQRPVQRAPSQPSRRAGIGDDFLKSFDDDLAPRTGPARPAAAKFDARAQANVASLIARQIEPCARRQRHLSESAKSMSVVLGLSFLSNGQLRGRPTVVRVDGVDGDNEQFRDLAVDQAIASYRQCAPLRLPTELYSTPQGGWKNIRIIFDVR